MKALLLELLTAILAAIFRKSPAEMKQARVDREQAKYDDQLKNWQAEHDKMLQALEEAGERVDVALHHGSSDFTGLQREYERLADAAKNHCAQRPRSVVQHRPE